MDKKYIKTLIEKGEGQDLEFKSKFTDENSRQELSQIIEKGILKIVGKGRAVRYISMVGDYEMKKGK
ncbi:MAG: hypothetical protein L6265_03195 [Thermoplasmatales archaeon]|nr:hypothetical protein [Thermoplasmatales archaeon]